MNGAIVQKIRVEALKPDGNCYRHWTGALLQRSAEGCIVDTPSGTRIYSGNELGWIQEVSIRTYFLSNYHLNLLEVCSREGKPVEIYVNIASPMKLKRNVLRYIDYELDVVRDLRENTEPLVVDRDEFEEARRKYGYSAELIETCISSSRLALTLTRNWVFRDDPVRAMRRISDFMSAGSKSGGT